MMTDDKTSPLTGLFAAPVYTAEPAADAPQATTPNLSATRPRPRAQAPRPDSRRAGLVAAATLAAMMLMLGLIAAGQGPKSVPAPRPAARAPQSAPLTQPAHPRARKQVRHARVTHPKRLWQRHHRRPARRVVAAPRAVAPTLVIPPAPAPAPAAHVSPAPYSRPAPAPVRSDEFF